MSPFVPPVPLPKRSGADFRIAASAAAPAFGVPVRWALRVLAWLAFVVASYLAWHAVSQTSVAGCSVGSNIDCDLVLSSSWSKWLGVPVAFFGLACYASLAALSVLLGLRSATANRWISTAFVMLSLVAAGASLWFIGIQKFAIHSFCLYCLITDACGIALGIIATVFAVRAEYAQRGTPRPRAIQPGVMALRTAFSTGSRSTPLAMSVEPSPPALVPAVGGAIPIIALLIGGQILFAAKTYDVQKVALKDSIELIGAKADGKGDASDTASTHVALRVPTETGIGERPVAPEDSTGGHDQSAGKSQATGDHKGADASQSSGAPAEPARQRLIKLLNGKLTLDVYQHPIIGSAEAPHIVVEMISYDCPHCRKMFATMKHALERYGDQVAILLMVIPMEKDRKSVV